MSKEKDMVIRPVDEKRLLELEARHNDDMEFNDTWFIHSVLAQCFLPYRNPNSNVWERRNGDFALSIQAGRIFNPETQEFQDVGLPYGAKPRLFQSYICTQAIRQKSPVISVETSMSSMMKELGLKVTGGKSGSINSFKEQITRFASSHFTIAGPAAKHAGVKQVQATPIKSMDIWFPTNPNQETLWPSEIVMTDDYFYSLKDHAIPYDFRALKSIQNNARAQDVYLWLTQRLCRIPNNKPLFMTWDMLREMFGGGMKNTRMFPAKFKETMKTVLLTYPDAKMQEEKEGFRFYNSPPPISRKVSLVMQPEAPQKLIQPSKTKEKVDSDLEAPKLLPETYEKAREVAPGFDIYHLERQWIESWKKRGRKPLKNPDNAFIGYCRACNKK